MALWGPQGVNCLTQTYRTDVYHIYKTPVPHPAAGCHLWYIQSGRRRPGKDAPPGPQDLMFDAAFEQRHTFCVAFDVTIGAKAFGSYPDARGYFDSIARFRRLSLANTGYEIIRADRESRLYMDIEWVDSVDGKRDPQTIIPLVINELVAYLRSSFMIMSQLSAEDFCVSRSRNPDHKQSYHIYMWNRAVFGDNHTQLRAVMLGFYQYLVLEMVEKGRSELEPIFFARSDANGARGGGCIIDFAVYTRNRQLRPIGAVKKTATHRVLVAFDIANNTERCDPYTMSFDEWSRYLASPPVNHGQLVLQPSARTAALLRDEFNPVKVGSMIQQTLAVYFTNKQLNGAMKLQLREFVSQQESDTSSKRKKLCSGDTGVGTAAAKRVTIDRQGRIELFETKSLDDYMAAGSPLTSPSTSQNAALFSSLLDDLRSNS